MTEREVMPRFPTSGQIIGALLAKLGVEHPVLQSRTARRYFSADLEHLVKDSTKAKIMGAIAEVLTDSGFIASPQARGDGYKPGSSFASMLQWHAGHWDLVRSFLRRRTMNVLPSNLHKVWEGIRQTCSHRSGSQVSRPPASCRVGSGSSGIAKLCQPNGPRRLSQPKCGGKLGTPLRISLRRSRWTTIP